ncbi:MAG: flagellar hook-associated protein FlgK [Pseudomonadota bacterium]
MSLSSALSIAYSGLVATSRSSEVVSNNIANALTEGYAKRGLDVSSRVLDGYGYGVAVEGISRAADPRATADRRAADAAYGRAADLGAGQQLLADRLGDPEDPSGFAGRARAFETALELARDTPESDAARSGLLEAAKRFAQAFSDASDEVATVRRDADAAIARQVDTVNANLAEIEELNTRIRQLTVLELDRSALMDARAGLIDEINTITPVRIANRENGEVALYTTGGTVLIDGAAQTLDFTASPIVTADMTVASGALSEITINGQALVTGAGGGRLDGGTLEAAFALRDYVGVEANAQLDALAGDLMQRLEAVDVDAGGAGLFTDGGAAYVAANEAGLAGRLTINAAADPDQGGALFRLRDGLGAAAEGAAGDDTVLTALTDAVKAVAPAPAASGIAGNHSVAGLAGEVAAVLQGNAARAEQETGYRAGEQAARLTAELSVTAVDSDAELQRLLKIEQNYAANARVIETVDFLMRRLLEI